MIHDTRPRASSTRGYNRTHNLDALGQCIYAVRTPEGFIKIGWSQRLGGRLSGLGGLGTLLAVRIGATMRDELRVHQSLAGHAIKGREWYPETAPVMAVVNAMRDEMGMPPL